MNYSKEDLIRIESALLDLQHILLNIDGNKLDRIHVPIWQIDTDGGMMAHYLDYEIICGLMDDKESISFMIYPKDTTNVFEHERHFFDVESAAAFLDTSHLGKAKNLACRMVKEIKGDLVDATLLPSGTISLTFFDMVTVEILNGNIHPVNGRVYLVRNGDRQSTEIIGESKLIEEANKLIGEEILRRYKC